MKTDVRPMRETCFAPGYQGLDCCMLPVVDLKRRAGQLRISHRH